MGRLDELHRQSLEDPQRFWGEAAQSIHWYRRPRVVLDDSNTPFYRWFSGGELNTCCNALDRWIDGGDGIDRRRADQVALIYDSPVTNTVARFTYRELRDAVATFAGLLQQLGVGRGDRVVIYMPMVPEAAIAMLACARIGAIHSVVFGGFAPHELAIRIDDAKPRVIVSASCGIEVKRVIEYKPLLDRAIEMAAHQPDRCVILQRPMAHASLVADRDIDWHEGVARVQPVPCVPVAATDPLYILYTSGTTGRPKGVVRDNGGHAVALRWSMSNIYGVQPGEVYWAASDVGWVVGHSYIVYGPLLAGCTSVLYEGKPVGTPDPGAFWRVISEHQVTTLFTAPTAFRAIKKEDPGGAHFRRYDLASFRALFLAGERTDPDTYHWATDLLRRPVIDHWWQTETGWPVAANCLGIEALPVKPGSPTKPVPGYQVDILAPDGTVLPATREGAIAIKLPLPPGTLPTLWNDDARFVSSYLTQFPGYYVTGDGGFFDADGYLNVMGRIDDVINVAGHRLSTGAMEEVIATHPAVAECAVIGVADELKGQVPVGFVVLKAGIETEPAIVEAALVQLIREQIGAVASFKRAHVVARLPKTRSGKILRATMRAIADGKPVDIPSTIDDPAALEEIKGALHPDSQQPA
ncbi:MAG: AMP-dependent synthetase and ligase [Deltaproteobacteria bacterium]|nr:AMP-dependent synthetase and ligase [Deltaproteobacteria bacterium]